MTKQSWLDYLEATWLFQTLRNGMNRGLVKFFRGTVFAGQQGLRVAEVACGSGYAAHLMALEPSVALSLAADLNLDDYRQAKIKDYRAFFVLMDLFYPALYPGSMDLVWNSSSIEEISQPERALKAMARLVKSGGRIFVGVPNSCGLAGLMHLIPSRNARAWLGKTYNRAGLRRLVESVGLQLERETSYLFGIFIGALAQKNN